jgi:predicted nucleotidyltransferase
MSYQQNLVRIKVVFDALEELGPKVIFVGGATVSLYADRIGEETRPTDDVDILIEVLHYSDYTKIEEKLRLKGFSNDVESGVICRYKVKGVVVDVMPTAEDILGFANKWYVEGYKYAMEHVINENYKINIFSPPYFLATKLEAFKDRGKNDGRWSADFEDIVHILNNRSKIWSEIVGAENNVKSYLLNEFKNLAENKYIDEWISSHLGYGEQERTYHIIGSINELLEKN